MPYYPTYEQLDLPQLTQEVLATWKRHSTFEGSQHRRRSATTCHFYEGPPSANGAPGIHHAMARALKDLFCRYKTMRGYHVPRRTGWDTHGLPVELQVEKELGITKEAIGTAITVEAYNRHCRSTVQRSRDAWEQMTRLLGYWTAMEDPYITSNNSYIANVWAIIKRLYGQGLLYQGHSIQPYSPAAGTGLSNHELNQPGCYRTVQETAITAQFKIVGKANTYFLAWTTTPWTLPANVALAVGKKITYACVRTHNPYTHLPVDLILAETSIPTYFDPAHEGVPTKEGWQRIARYTGKELLGWHYEQLMPYVTPAGEAFKVVDADFVTTQEGTGIVHIAPTFGSDDYQLAQRHGLPSIMVHDAQGQLAPIVDLQGRFVPAITDYAGDHVKEAYAPPTTTLKPGYQPVDLRIAHQLKQANKAFRVASHAHSYPHCWRTDKPILYYPVQAWFIKTTAYKDRLLALNDTISWHPPATGKGRFGDWLKGLVDWNISRSRFWGIPLPLWLTEEGDEMLCIGSVAQLQKEVARAVQAGFMQTALPDDADLHRPYVDDIILCSSQHKPMYRVPDVADVWLDSGAMPYAQHAAPIDLATPPTAFPADFIIEGIDQTRGWFFTLHALASMLFDSVAYRHVLATGLVLDKNGQKMSKRLGNIVEPIALLQKEGADAVRWYMIAHAHPWENLRFDATALQEMARRFFGTLHNTYHFFALYANLDGFRHEGSYPPLASCSQSDRWVLSRLQTLIADVTASYEAYNPTQAARALQTFVVDDLSNWYVRRNRKRFWHAKKSMDKRCAYQTLHTCLTTLAQLAAPIAPFYMERLYSDLHPEGPYHSVHWTDFPKVDEAYQESTLEQRMKDAQAICSLAHALRKKHRIKVRQPLPKLLLPADGKSSATHLTVVEDLIKEEVNVKIIEHLQSTEHLVELSVRPNLARLGKHHGSLIPAIKEALQKVDQATLRQAIAQGKLTLTLPETTLPLTLDDLLITTRTLPGWATATDGEVMVALDMTLTPDLVAEGLAREGINRLQKLRKSQGLAVEEKVLLTLYTDHPPLREALEKYQAYLATEVQAVRVVWSQEPMPSAHTLPIPPYALAVLLSPAKGCMP